MTVLAVSLLSAQLMSAQAQPSVDDQSTLHVYVNLVQIPVLVLNSSLHPMNRIPDSRFTVALEGLGNIKPARIRLQGDDPIDLTLIVDRSLRDDPVWDDLPRSLTPLIQALRSQDHLTIFTTDGCKAQRIGAEMAPFEANWLQLSAQTVTNIHPYKDGHHKKSDCPRPLTFWDLVNFAASRLSEYPGRKLIVTLGPGAQLSDAAAARLHSSLVRNSITLFPIVHSSVGGGVLPYGGARQIRSGSQIQDMVMVNPGMDVDSLIAMSNQAEQSGGMVLGTTQRGFPKTLAEPITLARGRYIIEFPRPDSLPPGDHHIFVADGNARDFIRPAGISVPIADAEEKAAMELRQQMLAADSATTSSAPSSKPPVDGPDTPAAPTTPQSAGAVSAPAVASAAKPIPPKAPEPDPTDITGDLRPSH